MKLKFKRRNKQKRAQEQFFISRKHEASIKNNSVEVSVHTINQASVPQSLSSYLTEASEKQKRGTKLQLVTDETEIQTKY